MDTLDIDLIHTGRWTEPSKAAQISAQALQRAQEIGLTDPVIIQPDANTAHEYEILGSPRTWLLAMQLQIPAVPVKLITTFTEAELEQCYGQHSHWLDEARHIQQLIENEKLSLAEAGRRLNKPRSEICNLMRILNIEPTVLEKIRNNNKITKGHAKVIAGLNKDQQQQLLDNIIEQQLSVQKTEQQAKAIREHTTTQKTEATKSADIIRLENLLMEQLNAKAEIDLDNHQLVIDYQGDLDILQGVLEKVGIEV